MNFFKHVYYYKTLYIYWVLNLVLGLQQETGKWDWIPTFRIFLAS